MKSRRFVRVLTALATLMAGSVPVCAPATAAIPRFQGYVAGAVTGPGHSFFVGDGLNVVFRDRGAARTRYRVCWRTPGHGPRCWSRRTARRGATSRIFTGAPKFVGSYTVRWHVNGTVVATWRFYNNVGD
jgi:hypothetical protein